MTPWSFEHFLCLALAMVFAAAVASFGGPLAARAGLIDDPTGNPRKLHREPTPLTGGLCVLPLAIAGLLGVALAGDAGRIGQQGMMSLAVAVLVSTIVGMWDDRKPLAALPRLGICGAVFVWVLLLAPLLILRAINFQLLDFVAALGLFAVPFTALCLLALQNAINLADGKNGLVIGLSIIWTVALLRPALSLDTPHPAWLALSLTAAALLAALPFNLKGKLFLGDSGAYGLGAFLGLMTIWLHKSGVGLKTLDVVIMFIVPVADMIRLFAIRLAAGRSPFFGDRSHLHHYLVDAVGLPAGLALYYTLVGAPIVIEALDLVHPVKVLLGALCAYAVVAWLAYRRREQELSRSAASYAI